MAAIDLNYDKIRVKKSHIFNKTTCVAVLTVYNRDRFMRVKNEQKETKNQSQADIGRGVINDNAYAALVSKLFQAKVEKAKKGNWKKMQDESLFNRCLISCDQIGFYKSKHPLGFFIFGLNHLLQ